MERITFDSGVKSFQIQDGGVLRFNPSDPNVYGRFLEAAEKIKSLEEELTEQANAAQKEESGGAVVQLMVTADREIKQVLGWVFGGENDFDKILGGVNLLAVADNGQQVIANLLGALEPVLVAGAQRFAKDKVDQALQKAKERRGAV